MAMGEEIQKIDPPRGVDRLRTAIFNGARTSVMKHMTDMRTFIPVPDYHILFGLIEKNVLSKDDLIVIADRYREDVKAVNPLDNGHPFCSLYRLGLLGVVEINPAGEFVQRFSIPDSLPMDRTVGILPKSKWYLIHPALDDFINSLRGGDYRLNFDRVNVIGDGLPWSNYRQEKYALKGDVAGFSSIMQSPEYGSIYPTLFQEWAADASAGLEFCSSGEGDSVLMVDGSPSALIGAAKMLSQKVRGFDPFPRDIRFGASVGPIMFRKRGDGNARSDMQPEGLALRAAARLEPLAKPNTIICDEKFVSAAVRFGVELNDFRPLQAAELPQLKFSGGKFYVQKRDADPASATMLWDVGL